MKTRVSLKYFVNDCRFIEFTFLVFNFKKELYFFFNNFLLRCVIRRYAPGIVVSGRQV